MKLQRTLELRAGAPCAVALPGHPVLHHYGTHSVWSVTLTDEEAQRVLAALEVQGIQVVQHIHDFNGRDGPGQGDDSISDPTQVT